jgi:hypothetical protein
MSPVGLGPQNDCACEDQQHLLIDRPIPSSERMLHKDYNRKGFNWKIEILVVTLKGLVAKTN